MKLGIENIDGEPLEVMYLTHDEWTHLLYRIYDLQIYCRSDWDNEDDYRFGFSGEFFYVAGLNYYELYYGDCNFISVTGLEYLNDALAHEHTEDVFDGSPIIFTEDGKYSDLKGSEFFFSFSAERALEKLANELPESITFIPDAHKICHTDEYNSISLNGELEHWFEENIPETIIIHLDENATPLYYAWASDDDYMLYKLKWSGDERFDLNSSLTYINIESDY